ncbi:MAG: VWA domain-containing protein [Dehalococcoidia bacterium]
MSELTFARPWILLALAVLPLLATLWFVGSVRARRRARTLSRGYIPGARHVAAMLFLAAGGLAIVAAAQPQWGEEHTRVPRSGAELIIVLDVSRSMDARDVEPSRMEATKAMLQSALGGLGGDRVGMVIFGGDARLRFPLTIDLAAASQVIGTIETAPVLVSEGSSAAAGLEIALDSFEEDADSNRVILLITDGDDLGADPVAVAQRIQASGVELLVAGAGTPEGGTIPVYDAADGGSFTNKLDGDGNPIITRLNEPFLRALAVASGGRYLGSGLDTVPGAVSGRLAALERTRFEEETRPIPIERYQWFAGAALALVVLASLLEWIPRPSRRTAVAALAVGATLLAGCATRAHELNEEARDAFRAGDTEAAINLFLEAQAESPDDPRVRLNLAAAYHQAERYEDAALTARTLLVDGDPGIRARAHASIGHHLFATGNLEGSLAAFRQALLEDPGDDDSRHDYEVVLRLLQPPGEAEPDPGETPGEGQSPGSTPEPGGTPEPGMTPPPDSEPGEATPDSSRPGSLEEIERRLADLDAEIARIVDEAGEELDAAQSVRILQLLAERQRVSSVRDALEGGGDPNDY